MAGVIAPGLGVLALRAAAPPVLAVGRWSLGVLQRHNWLGWCAPRQRRRFQRSARCGAAWAPRARAAKAAPPAPPAHARGRWRGCACTAAEWAEPRADAARPPRPRARLASRRFRWMCGFAIAQYGAARGKRRRMRTELAHVLADISGADLQRLLGALPAWVSYPEYERVTWLNTVIKEVRKPQQRAQHAARMHAPRGCARGCGR